MTAPDPDALLARVRQILFDFAGVEEKLSHGAPFFHVKGRGIASFASGHHQSGHVTLRNHDGHGLGFESNGHVKPPASCGNGPHTHLRFEFH